MTMYMRGDTVDSGTIVESKAIGINEWHQQETLMIVLSGTSYPSFRVQKRNGAIVTEYPGKDDIFSAVKVFEEILAELKDNRELVSIKAEELRCGDIVNSLPNTSPMEVVKRYYPFNGFVEFCLSDGLNRTLPIHKMVEVKRKID